MKLHKNPVGTHRMRRGGLHRPRGVVNQSRGADRVREVSTLRACHAAFAICHIPSRHARQLRIRVAGEAVACVTESKCCFLEQLAVLFSVHGKQSLNAGPQVLASHRQLIMWESVLKRIGN